MYFQVLLLSSCHFTIFRGPDIPGYFSKFLWNIQFMRTLLWHCVSACLDLEGLWGILRPAYDRSCWSVAQHLKNFGDKTKNTSGYRHSFLSHSFTLYSQNVSKALNQVDLVCVYFKQLQYSFLSSVTIHIQQSIRLPSHKEIN